MKNFKSKALMVVLFVIAMVFMTLPVGATLQVAVTVYDTANTATGNSFVVVDNDGFYDQDMTVGTITLANGVIAIPNVEVQGSFHTSKLAGNLLTSGSSSLKNNRTDPIRVVVAVGDTDYISPVDRAEVTGSGTFVNAIGSTIHLTYYDDPNNTQGANYAFANYDDFVANVVKITPGDLIASYDYTATKALDSFSYNEDNIVVKDEDPFSMTLKFDYTLPAGGSLISRGQSMLKFYTPEFPTLAVPAAMIVGFAGLVLFIRKREF